MFAGKRRAAALGLLLWATAACSRPTAERRLVIAYPRGLHSLDLYDPAHEQYAAAILGNVYETLVEVGPDLALKPGLAESWHSPDDLTRVFVLRPGVRLHDGSTLTAQQVAASFDRARHVSWEGGELAPVAEVKARGEREVVFTTRDRFDSLPARLTSVSVAGAPPANGPAPGTGPYRLASSPSGGPTVLEASPQYRGAAPGIRTVEFQVVPDPAERLRRLERGQVHLITDVPGGALARLQKQPGVQIASRPSLRVVFLAMDCAHAPFRDPRVREALDLALDRDALVAGALGGYAEVVEQLPGRGEVGFEPRLARRRPEPRRARELLARAGLAGGFASALDYMEGAGDEVVAALAGQAARAGIALRPNRLSSAEFLARVENRRTPLYLMRWTNDTGSAHESYASLLHSPGERQGAVNGGAYANPALDTLLEEFAREPRQEKRVRILQRATRLIHEDRPLLPLYRPHELFAFSQALDFEPKDQGSIRVARLRWRR
jgi:peptide/nickel transport system substrate-binding protein